MSQRVILTVNGSGATIYPEIYREIDPSVKLVAVRDMEDLRLEAHGVLLMGGSDINPDLYGEKPTYSAKPDVRRDWLEIGLMQKATDCKLPILGICRGHQMLAVAYGGKLHQDLSMEQVVVGSHGSSHAIECRSAALHRHIPTLTVNSYHHQAISKVPRGFRIAATSLDGVIESIYREGVLGVQWHPEFLWEQESDWANLFYWHLRGLKVRDTAIAPVRAPRAVLEAQKASGVHVRLQRNFPGWDWLWGEGDRFMTTSDGLDLLDVDKVQNT